MNLAAQAGVRYSIENPQAYTDTNLVEFGNILEGCRHNGVEHLVYAVRFAEVVYVLHAFQEKSRHGVKTPQTDVKLIAERLKRAQADYGSRGKP